MRDRRATRLRQTGRTGATIRCARWVICAGLLGVSPAAVQAQRPATAPSPLTDPAQNAPRVIEPIPTTTGPPMTPIAAPEVPRVIPINPAPGAGAADTIPAPAPRPRVLTLRRDSTGLVPTRPPGPTPIPPVAESARKVEDVVEVFRDPEAEISLVVGRSKLLETRRLLTRIAVADPTVADIELMADEPNSRLLNLYGRSFGTTSLTLWDEQNRPISFLVRVTLDAKDLESRIMQVFPGTQIHVRQVGPQLILEGQVADNKTMSDIIALVTNELRNVLVKSVTGGAGGGAAMGGGGGGMGGGGGGAGGGMGPGGMPGSPLYVINRVHIPGPRQVMLHVKIAELNRTAMPHARCELARRPQQQPPRLDHRGCRADPGSGGPDHPDDPEVGRTRFRPSCPTSPPAATASNVAGSLFGIFHAGQFSLFLERPAVELAGQDPGRADPDGARRPAGPVPGGRPLPLPGAAELVDSRRDGGRHRAVRQLRGDPLVPPPDHAERRDPPGRRAGVQPAQLRGRDDDQRRHGPAIDQRSARTMVELREGQTLAIAGLLQQTTNATTNRIPGLGDMPIVGPWLFSFNHIETVETELVVLVTPELVAPMEPNEVGPAPGDRVLQPNDFEFYFLGRIESKLGREFRATVARARPAERDETLTEREHLGRRPPRVRRLMTVTGSGRPTRRPRPQGRSICVVCSSRDSP